MSSVDWIRLAQDLARVLGQDAVVRERPIGPETTYRVGGAARVGVTLAVDADVAALAEVVAASGTGVMAVGKGSNLLVADAGFDGVAVWLGPGFDWVEIDGLDVNAGAAAGLPVLARQSAAAASLIHAEVADLRGGAVEQWDRPRLELGYRRSALADHHLVLGAELGLYAGDAAASQAQIAEIVAWRRENQPGGQNAGSVFTNPDGDSAGRIIDAAGLRGLRVGTASVSEKHANFFIADRGGSADDLHALMGEVFARVRAKFDVALVPETRLVGFETGPWPGQPG